MRRQHLIVFALFQFTTPSTEEASLALPENEEGTRGI